MIEKPEKRDVSIGLKVTRTLKAALDAAASSDHRPVASLVEKVLTEWLRENGYLPK
ncbi:MAG: hypothetical protein FWD68_14725 [Alphaproteobacteria bacterium]|nr:hypothetical protein [Alphaproteobacteria bacterium]